jgi:hypothetical protein
VTMVGRSTNLHPFADAIELAQASNARPNATFMHPRSWRALLKLRRPALPTRDSFRLSRAVRPLRHRSLCTGSRCF